MREFDGGYVFMWVVYVCIGEIEKRRMKNRERRGICVEIERQGDLCVLHIIP